MIEYAAVILSGTFFLFWIMLRTASNRWLDIKERDMLYLRHKNISKLLKAAMELAYQKVFREDILAQVSSGYKLSGEEIMALQKEYISCILTYIGDNVVVDLETIHGGLDSLYSVWANDLVIRIENDEVYMLSQANSQDYTQEQ